PRPGRSPGPRRLESDSARHQVLIPLTPYDLTGLAAAAEDDRWPRDTVVVVGERIAIGAGRRRDENVAGSGLGQGDVTNEHVAGLTVLAGDMAALGAGRERTVSDDRLIR